MSRQISLMRYIDPATSTIDTVFKPGVTFSHLIEGGPDDVSPIYRHGAKYGNGGFTGQRCMTHAAGEHQGQRVMFRMQDHISRLLTTLQALEWMDIPWNRAALSDAMFRLMAANTGDDYFSLTFASGGDVGVMSGWDSRRRAFVEVQHHAFINSRDYDPVRRPYLGPKAMAEGITVRLTEDDIRRRPPGPLAQAKVSSNYVDSNVAKSRAIKAGCEDGLILDHTGHNIAELSVSNVIGLFGDTLISPDASSGALNGITKRTLMETAYEMYGFKTTDEPIPVRRLAGMRMMIACGTAIGAVRITKIVRDSNVVLWEQPEDFTAIELAWALCADIWRIQRGEIAAVNNKHPEWFEPIPARYLQQLALPLV